MTKHGVLWNLFDIRHSGIRHNAHTPMPGPAQVRSTEAIEAFKAALAKFEERVTAALDSLDGEIRRADNWVEHDRPAYWRRQIHEAEEEVLRTKLDLEHCRMYKTMDGERPQCREQEAAYKAAQRRLDVCREKGDVTRKWQRTFRHESLEYKGRLGQLRRAIEHGMPEARAVLEKIMRRIDEYQLERPPEAIPLHSGAPSAPASSMARSESPPTAPSPAVEEA